MFSLLRLDSADTSVKQHDLLVKTRVQKLLSFGHKITDTRKLEVTQKIAISTLLLLNKKTEKPVIGLNPHPEIVNAKDFNPGTLSP